MGVELELTVLLAIAILGPAAFARFELETPWWRKALKWSIVVAITLALYRGVGHCALAFPLAAAAAGLTFHFWWCRRHGIDPIRATPQDKYYRLRGWIPPAS
ncbi:MAG: hypothetical protein AB7L66_22750 [Gemmatimonadales bacterium]